MLYRTKMLRCRSDEDFLAKVHCVRQAMAVLLQDATILEWFISMGKGMIGDVLFKANYVSFIVNSMYVCNIFIFTVNNIV